MKVDRTFPLALALISVASLSFNASFISDLRKAIYSNLCQFGAGSLLKQQHFVENTQFLLFFQHAFFVVV